MHTRVQLRVLYSESAQVKLGEGRGQFDDKKIRVGPAYQAVIPVLGSWSRADETARAGYAQAQEECPPKHGPVMARTKRPRDPVAAAAWEARHVAIEAGATRAAAEAAYTAAAKAYKAGAGYTAAAAAGAAAAADQRS